MEKNITNSHSQNRDGNSNKNNQNLDSNNVEFIEYFNIAFKYKGKRSIKNAKNNTLLKILLPIILFSILFTIGIIMLIIFLFRKKKVKSKIQISVSELSYEKAEKMLNLEIIGVNHNLLNRSLSKINNSLSICGNTNFSIINSTLNHTIPHFLNNATKSALKVIKADLELYTEKYEELIDSINNFTMQVINSFENSYSPLNKMKKETKSIIYRISQGYPST